MLKRLLKNKKIKIGISSLCVLIMFLCVAPLFVSYSFDEQIRGSEIIAPSGDHVIGTDALGRDLFIRLIVALSISISIAVIATLINLTIGLTYGVFSGYTGKITDVIMMRMVDVLSSIPEILYLILIMIFLKDISFLGDDYGLLGISLTLSIAFWIPFARVIRTQVLSIKEKDYIVAAKSYGASDARIILKYILPNCIPVILITLVSRIPVAIFFEAFLSFVGLGVEPPLPSLGSLLADGLGSMRSAPHLLLYPAFSIISIILIFNIITDGLRDVFDNRKI